MATKIMMPKLGMDMKEGSVVAWSFKEGDRINEGDVVVQIETEKITYDVEAPATGILRKIVAREGEARLVGELLGVIASEDEAFDEREFVIEKAPPSPAAVEEPKRIPDPSKDTAPSPRPEERVRATPAAKRLAREKGLDIVHVSGTGPGGRITEKDVLAAVKTRQEPKQLEVSEPGKMRPGTTIPITRMRSIIAERLTKSWVAPHIYLAAEIDATEMGKLLKKLLPAIQRETGQKLTYNDLLIQVVALAIEKFPAISGIIEAEHIRIPDEINIGLAVAVEDGLLVPVVRRANESSLTEIVRQRADLVDRARRQQLAIDELRGGTFSISNLGMFDIDFFTAILNPPQSGILSVGKVKDTPAVKGGKVQIVPLMKLVLGVDHRVVDGAVGAAFLQELKRNLESPRDALAAG